jgi:hypothetical protein
MAELGALIVDKAKSISVVLGYDADQAENRSSQQSQSARTSYRRSEKDP